MKKLYIYLIISILIISKINYSYSQNSYNYDIKYHRLEFNVDPAIRYIDGVVCTYFEPLNDNFSEIAFDLSNELTTDSVIYHAQNMLFTHQNDTLLIMLNNTIPKNQLDSVIVYYQGVPDASQRSFALSEHDGVPIMWTLSEPLGAKDWWACKEQLNDKIDSIDMYVVVPQGNKAAGNGLLISETNIEDKTIVHWKHLYPAIAYLIGFSVTNYVEYSDFITINDTLEIEVLNYVYPEDLAYAQENTPNMTDVFQFFCDSLIIYPFYKEKYGHAQFNVNGGMEHQTMSFMGNFGHSLMAHELAHQWFGDYITCGSWQDIWLNESFTTYFEGLTAELMLAEYDWKDWKSSKIADITDEPDGSVFCQDTTVRSNIFSKRLTYYKGAMVLNTLRWKLGDYVFFNSIRDYLNDENLTYSFAKTDDIKYHFEQNCNCDLTNFFNDWFYGEGYPLYTVLYSQNTDNEVEMIINQDQTHNSVDFFEMQIQIKFYGENKDTTLIFDNTFSGEKYNFQLDFKIENLYFDPNLNIITSGVNIKQMYSQDDFQVALFPNPATDFVTVNFPINTKIYSYTICSPTGQSIITKKLDIYSNKFNIYIEALPIGIYILHIETSNGNIIKKFEKLQ